MKNFKKLALRVALAFFLLSTVVIIIETKTGANAALADNECGVSNAQCAEYLSDYGYTNIVFLSLNGRCNRIFDTSNPHNTIVYVSNGIIVAHDDIAN